MDKEKDLKDKIVEVLNDYTSTLECSKCGKHIEEIIVSESFDLLASEIIQQVSK